LAHFVQPFKLCLIRAKFPKEKDSIIEHANSHAHIRPYREIHLDSF
jgi:hypothetical protein